MENRVKYRLLLCDVMHSMDDDVDEAEGLALADQLRKKNPQYFKVAKFHAGAVLHTQEADAIEAGEADGPESPDNLRHLAGGSFAHAWAFAKELGEDDLVAEVLKDAKRNVAVYDATEEKLEEVRQHLEKIRHLDNLEATR